MAKKKKTALKAKPEEIKADVRTEYNWLIAGWVVAILLTFGEFALVYRKFKPDTFLNEGRPSWLLIALGVVAIAEFAGSIWLWRGIQLDAAKKLDLKLSQMGYLIAWLLCLAIGPLGFVITQSNDGRYWYGFIIMSALGVLYHQPARETLAAAAPKVETKPAPTVEVTSEAPGLEEPAETIISDHASGEEDDVAAAS